MINQKGPKIYSEAETRKRLLNTARWLGCEGDVKQIFDRYGLAALKCTNKDELRAIAEMCAAEIHQLFNMRGSLEVNGKTIIEEKK